MVVHGRTLLLSDWISRSIFQFSEQIFHLQRRHRVTSGCHPLEQQFFSVLVYRILQQRQMMGRKRRRKSLELESYRPSSFVSFYASPCFIIIMCPIFSACMQMERREVLCNTGIHERRHFYAINFLWKTFIETFNDFFPSCDSKAMCMKRTFSEAAFSAMQLKKLGQEWFMAGVEHNHGCSKHKRITSGWLKIAAGSVWWLWSLLGLSYFWSIRRISLNLFCKEPPQLFKVIWGHARKNENEINFVMQHETCHFVDENDPFSSYIVISLCCDHKKTIFR